MEINRRTKKQRTKKKTLVWAYEHFKILRPTKVKEVERRFPLVSSWCEVLPHYALINTLVDNKVKEKLTADVITWRPYADVALDIEEHLEHLQINSCYATFICYDQYVVYDPQEFPKQCGLRKNCVPTYEETRYCSRAGIKPLVSWETILQPRIANWNDGRNRLINDYLEEVRKVYNGLPDEAIIHYVLELQKQEQYARSLYYLKIGSEEKLYIYERITR